MPRTCVGSPTTVLRADPAADIVYQVMRVVVTRRVAVSEESLQLSYADILQENERLFRHDILSGLTAVTAPALQ